MKYTDILAANKLLSQKISTTNYQIGILSNIIINPLKDILEYQCLKNNINPTIVIGNYDNIAQDSLAFKDKDLIIIFFDSLNIIESVDDYFESITPHFYDAFLVKCKNELDIIFKNLENTSSVIINSFSISAEVLNHSSISKFQNLINDLNGYLRENLPNNFNIVNIDKIFIKLGLLNFIDYRFFHSSKAPYTFNFFRKYVEDIEFFLLKNNGKLKKAIVFDCDNTLWKGILGEDGIDKIDMSASSKVGKYFNKVQRIITYLSNNGVIIGICSKNNENDVLDVFKNHIDIFLKEENIVIHKINWIDKATNLIEISKELNIGLDSIIFVDDSSFEINLINEHLPQVTTIQVPENIYLYPSLLLEYVNKYFNLNSTEDDLKKTAMYKEQFLRAQEKIKHVSIEQYLSSLEIEIFIEKDNIMQVDRLAQLTQKTNQFNLTTRRYTEVQIKNFILRDDYHVFSLNVKDKFGDNGITGVCIINQQKTINGDFLYIDTLLMSCRIIGRNIEFQFLNTIINYFKRFRIKEIHSVYIPSNKNEQVKYFYEKFNFNLISNLEEKKYCSIIDDLFSPNISYIKVNTK
jgi:FkbH-like protein